MEYVSKDKRMKVRVKVLLLILSALLGCLLFSGKGSLLTFLSMAWLFMLLPGYMILSLLPFSRGIPTLYKLPLSFALSLAYYLIPIMILCFKTATWSVVLIVVIVQNVVLGIAYLVFDRVEVSLSDLRDRVLSILAPTNRRKLVSLVLSVAVVAIALFGMRFVETNLDSVFHTGRINQLSHAERVTNFFYSNRLGPFSSAADLALPADDHRPLHEEVGATYEFGYYFASLALFCRISGLNTVEFQYFMTKMLFALALFTTLFLGWILFKDPEYQVLLACVYILSFVILKNYFNTAKLGNPPYFFVDIFHPTNIVALVFLPLIMCLFMMSLSASPSRKMIWPLISVCGLLAITTIFIHRIGIVYLGLWMPAVLIIKTIVSKEMPTKRILGIATIIILAVIGYLAYVLISIKGVETSFMASLTNGGMQDLVKISSIDDFVKKYFIYIENTFLKLYYFPLSLFVLVGIFFLRRKDSQNTNGFILLFSGLACFFFLMLPGINILVVKYLRAFIQRVFFFLSLELIATAILIKIVRGMNKRQFVISFQVFIALSVALTLGFETNRKGNQKYLWEENRYAFIEYIEKNIPANAKYLADINTEVELNAASKLHSLSYNPTQDYYIRNQIGSFTFFKRLNAFLYRGEYKEEFREALTSKGIKYLIISENDYFGSLNQMIGEAIFNSEFKSLYRNDDMYTILYSDGYHCIINVN